ncbi:MAG: ATP-binding cassette domain-containing protein, partial [Planctomycetes bacterium]|nr:ATP-binding cassette domain-containing protein [Planctomycetota bacterium]
MSVLRLRGLQAGNLKNLDLDISQGQWTGIHGPSGAGKSALLFGVLEAVAKRRFQILHDPHALPSSNHEDFEGLADEVAGLQPVVAWEGEIPKRRAEVRLMEALQLEPLLLRETKLHGERKCSSCESIWQPKPFLELLDLADSWSEGERLEVGFEASGIPAETLLLGGLVRFHHEGKSLRLEDVEGDLLPGAYCTLDRFRWSQVKQLRLGDALSEADRRQRAVRIQLGAKEWVVPPSTECPQCGVVHSSVGLQEIFKSQDSYGWQLHQRDLLQWLEEPMEVWCDRFDLHDLEDVSRRLLGMVRTGLGHLHPARALGTLSLGESRRLELCAMLSQVRRNQLILFDEPGMGLHGRERKAVVQLLRELVEQGNTVLTADPAREFLEGADSWVRLGPGGGRMGGTLTGQGTRSDLPPQAEGLVPPDQLR